MKINLNDIEDYEDEDLEEKKGSYVKESTKRPVKHIRKKSDKHKKPTVRDEDE